MKHPAIEYLKTHTLGELYNEHGVKHRFNRCKDKISLDYDTYVAKNNDDIACGCRGLIVRPKNNVLSQDVVVGEVDVLCWPMHRFFNYGDSAAVNVNLIHSSTVVNEKLDGTMCAVYYDNVHEKWYVSTRSVPEADVFVQNTNFQIENTTFSQLFCIALQEGVGISFEELCSTLNKKYTYVFELTTPYNIVVVRHKTSNVFLIAVRDNQTGLEHDHEQFLPYVQKPRKLSIDDVDMFVSNVKSNNEPERFEGVVVRDMNFNRIKIKSDAYVKVGRFAEMLSLSKRSVLQSILDESVDDIIPLLNESMKGEIEDVRRKLAIFCHDIDAQVAVWKERADGDRKAYARLVQSSEKWHVPFYELFARNGTASDWLKGLATSRALSQAMLDNLIYQIGWLPKVGK